MKKRMLGLLAVLIILSGCGKESLVTEEVPVAELPKEEIVTEETTENEQTKEEQLTPEKEAEEQTEIVPLTLFKSDLIYEEWGETMAVCTAKSDCFYLTEDDQEKYPNLKNALKEEAENTAEQMELFITEIASYAAEMEENEFFAGYTDESEWSLQRADELIVSIRQDQYSYTGGAHPNYGTGGLNIDPVTGEKLVITDVANDLSLVTELLNEKLIEKYGEDAFYDIPAEVFKEYTPEMFAWTMNYQGITFYFSPYELAPYAAGMQTVTIWFEEAAELLDEKYTKAPSGGYALEIPVGKEFSVDLNKEDEKKDEIIIGRSFVGEDGESYQISISINDEIYSGEEVFYYADMQASLVSLNDQGEEKFYIYAAVTTEGTGLYVYELSEDGILFNGCVSNVRMPGIWLDQWEEYYESYTYATQVMNDPSEWSMTSRMHMMGIMDGWKVYHAEFSDGLPKAEEAYYTLPEDQAPLTSKIDLQLEILPENTMEVIKAGTIFYYLRTDNETFVDFRMEDGRECRISFENPLQEKTINGYEMDECFDGIPFTL